MLSPKTSKEPWGQSDVRFLETLAAHAASALENARLNEIARKIQSSLQESEERFMTLAERMPAAVFIHRAGSIVYANAAAVNLTGYAVNRLKIMSLNALLQPASDNQAPGEHAAWADQGTVRTGTEVRVVQENGSQRWAIMTSAVMEYGEEAAVMSILFDITIHKQTEGKLRYEQIREAVRRLAWSLVGDLERLSRDLRHSAAIQEYGDEDRGSDEPPAAVRTSAEQAEILIRTLQEFCTDKPSRRTLQDVTRLVASSRPVLAALLPGKYELVIQSCPEPLQVMADPTRIESALMNLVLHARDRMQRGGVVTIATGRAEIDTDVIWRSGYGRVGSYAVISVLDTGEDLTAEEQERLFEPFFLSADAAPGDGMSLAVAYDIIKEHEGYITVSSRPGQGTSYITYLPLVV